MVELRRIARTLTTPDGGTHPVEDLVIVFSPDQDRYLGLAITRPGEPVTTAHIKITLSANELVILYGLP